ncbi:hypothetical protein KTD31_02995 [Burkholderia multivorans]|uniref:hypothetical protein n=1 Tax=Burkholderia multivorans TaxID=87883 RepID=UPI001C2317ED|nr:hypothetical protein [Burkholderia multivorans]MBU9200319.1 hypothetical protein [Burkholderia multivorans]MDN8078555.1 hypothetical protein [Burkholderia multivorans]
MENMQEQKELSLDDVRKKYPRMRILSLKDQHFEDRGLGVLYRVEAQWYAPMLDEYDEPSGSSSVVVTASAYPVVRVTPKGKWISLGFGGKKFVLSEARKRYAHETVDLAVESFRARKNRRISILQNQIARAHRELAKVESEMSLSLKSVPLSATELAEAF